MKLVECVPNFSEGKKKEVIREICLAARGSKARVVSMEPDGDYNRSVLTFVGDPDAVLEGAFAVIKRSCELIDMSKHKGGHPRMGACDVTPFVPVSEVSLKECAGLAKTLGKRVADELGLSVYLYGMAGKKGRRDLSVIRKGQYEGLCEKLKDPFWKPDFGPVDFNAKFGATLIGARPFLVAYNVNLESNDVEAANEIAKKIRTSGRKAGGVWTPGTLKQVKGMGVLLKEKNIAQISMNLIDYNITNMDKAIEEVRKFAKEMGQKVTGSEICGIVPFDAIVNAGRFYGGRTISKDEAVDRAIVGLGLSDLYQFDPDKKILEKILEKGNDDFTCSQ